MLAVRWYLRYSLFYRDIEELLAERGITVDHVMIGPSPTWTSPERSGDQEPGDSHGDRESHLGTGEYKASWSGLAIGSRPLQCGRSCMTPVLIPHRVGPVPPGDSSSPPRPRPFLAADFVHVDTVVLTRLYGTHRGRTRLPPGTSGRVTAHPTGAWTTQGTRRC